MTDAATLRERVALVTGGSRGVGKGVAEALGEAGATVYVTGRTVAETEFATKCIPVACDHTGGEIWGRPTCFPISLGLAVAQMLHAIGKCGDVSPVFRFVFSGPAELFWEK